MNKSILAGAAALLLTVCGTANAVSYNLVGWYQRSGGGNLSSLAFKAGAAQGCPGPTYIQPCFNPSQAWTSSNGVIAVVSGGAPTWDWNTATDVLTQTGGTFWAASFIGSNPGNSTVISDRGTSIVIDVASPGVGTSNAATHQCVEGTFLVTVGANGCKNINLGPNFADNTATVWNSGGNSKCVTQTINPDDFSLLDGSGPPDPGPPPYVPGTPEPRGPTVQTAGQAGGGCAQTSGAYDMWHVVVDDGTYLILSESAFLGTCYLFGVEASSGCTTTGSTSFLIFVAPGAPDTDGDGNFDGLDNCPSTSNPGQQDLDADGIGNVCDADIDGDTVANGADNCPNNANTTQTNTDGDLVGNACDNCTLVSNTTAGVVTGTAVLASQLDADADQYGNICDGDINNSGLTTAADNTLLRNVLNQAYGVSATTAKSDMNGSGLVTAADNTLLRNRLNQIPGPSGYCGTVPPPSAALLCPPP